MFPYLKIQHEINLYNFEQIYSKTITSPSIINFMYHCVKAFNINNKYYNWHNNFVSCVQF